MRQGMPARAAGLLDAERVDRALARRGHARAARDRTAADEHASSATTSEHAAATWWPTARTPIPSATDLPGQPPSGDAERDAEDQADGHERPRLRRERRAATSLADEPERPHDPEVVPAPAHAGRERVADGGEGEEAEEQPEQRAAGTARRRGSRRPAASDGKRTPTSRPGAPPRTRCGRLVLVDAVGEGDDGLVEAVALRHGRQRVGCQGDALVEGVVVEGRHQHLTDDDRLPLAVGRVRVRRPRSGRRCRGRAGRPSSGRARPLAGPDGMRPRTTVNDGRAQLRLHRDAGHALAARLDLAEVR